MCHELCCTIVTNKKILSARKTPNEMDKSNSELKSGQLLDFELRKESRRFTGYTLFLSFFFVEWKELTHHGRLNELGIYLHGDSGSDSDSMESLPSILHVDVIRHAAKRWNGMTKKGRNAGGLDQIG